ncbi:hypothetical protein Taro_033260 [Colocasia esculenta]|uniref:Uncharacterized protein n=1 Tax=Colocasia esculenta TaxID=4460 RepID=A0A843W6G7_COLES|nr:hypothetical protein [Colocasia esculenta]
MVDVVIRLEMASRGVRTGVWFKQCRPKHTLRQHCRLSCRLRLRLQLQFLNSKAMVVLPSWRGEAGVPVLEEDIGRSDSEREA